MSEVPVAVSRLREAASVMATLLSFELSRDARKVDAHKALDGDFSGLYEHETRALRWLARQWERDPETLIDKGAAPFVKLVPR